MCVLSSVEPAAKCIVFSQWDKLLNIVSTALEHNRVRSVRPGAHGAGGKKKLQDVVQLFSTDESIHVLLLPIEKAGRGINIVAATHVMLLEPMLTPDLELQAAGVLAVITISYRWCVWLRTVNAARVTTVTLQCLGFYFV